METESEAKTAHARHAALRQRLRRTTAWKMAAIALCIGGFCAGLAVKQHGDAVEIAQSLAMAAAHQEAITVTEHLRLAFTEPILPGR